MVELKVAPWGCVLVALCGFMTSSCGSDSDGECRPATIVGSPFFSEGSAILEGTGTLPPGIPDGLDLDLFVETDGFSSNVLSENFFTTHLTCGPTFDYTVKALDAGTYTLHFEILDPDSEDIDPLYEGTATQEFTIAEGQQLRFDATFELQ